MHKMALEQGLKPLLVHIRYGQDFTHHDHKLPIECRHVGITGLLLDFEKTYGASMPQDYIPSRNMMLVSVAAAIAEQEGIKDIWYGANLSDTRNGYPDCTSEWIGKINEILPVNLHAPLLLWTQEEVIAKLDDNVSWAP